MDAPTRTEELGSFSPLSEGEKIPSATVDAAVTYAREECRALLKRWDAGESVWSVEMGGMGPGYEQAIQNTAFEVLRTLVDHEFNADDWPDPSRWAADLSQIEGEVFPRVEDEGLSGAQWGAAVNIASVYYRKGHDVGRKLAGLDRAIQVNKTLPRRQTRATGESPAATSSTAGKSPLEGDLNPNPEGASQ